MPDGGGYSLKICRSCGRNSREVRFDRMSANRCVKCDDARKAQRNQRIAERGPRCEAISEPAPAAEPRQNESHLRWVRSLPCSVKGEYCRGPVHAHHVRENTGGGTGLKPGSEWTVPLCESHHMAGHTRGWETFQAEHGVDLRALATRLAATSPHIKKAENV
jgi:hypothetical protein